MVDHFWEPKGEILGQGSVLGKQLPVWNMLDNPQAQEIDRVVLQLYKTPNMFGLDMGVKDGYPG